MQADLPLHDLRIAYEEATKPNGLISLLAHLREPNKKYTVKKTDIYNIFKNCPLWEEQDTKSGHVKFKHKITQIVIGYQNHGGPTMDPGGADQLLNNVQTHLNIMCNDIFHYTVGNWKTEPNYQQAAANLAHWKAKQS